MTDIVERLREDAAGLRKAVSQASFASDTYVRVKQPDLLIAVLDEAAAEIEQLREELDVNRTALEMKHAEIERLRVLLRWAQACVPFPSDLHDDIVDALKEKAHEPG